jgi:hypothetical protein
LTVVVSSEKDFASGQILRASPFDLRKSYAFPAAIDSFRGYAAVLGFGRRSREVS